MEISPEIGRAFDSAEVPEPKNKTGYVPTYTPPPDGKYPMVIEEVGFKENKSYQFFTWTLRIEGGEQNNKIVKKDSMLRPDLMMWIKKDIETCGVTVNDFTELLHPEKREEFVGILLDVSVVTKPDNKGVTRTNYYINGRIDESVDNTLSDNLPF